MFRLSVILAVTVVGSRLSNNRSASTLSDRRGLWAFILGVILVAGGVLMHAPMFWMGRMNHFQLYVMTIGWDMVVGMVAIVAGCGIAAYGLLPRDNAEQLAASQE